MHSFSFRRLTVSPGASVRSEREEKDQTSTHLEKRLESLPLTKVFKRTTDEGRKHPYN